jgi:hypothetical protein
MKQFPLSKAFFIAIPALMLFACTCNTPAPPPPDSDESDTITRGFLIPNYYEILNCTRADFIKLKPFRGGSRKGSLFFKYQINSNFLGLAGWQFGQFNTGGANRPGFDSLPDLTLQAKGNSSIPISPGMYIGDLIIGNMQVKDIKSTLESDTLLKFVVFSPIYYGADSTHVSYTIILSNSKTGLESDFQKDETGVAFKAISMSFDAIPIPPGGGNVLDDN